MKFQPTVQILRGPMDAAPLVGVLFLLLIFVLLSSQYVFVPGVSIRLPEAAGEATPVPSGPTVAVVVDQAGRAYFDNEVMSDKALETQLAVAVRQSPQALTLVVLADKLASYETIMRVTKLAQKAGIKNAVLSVRPRVSFVPVTTAAP